MAEAGQTFTEGTFEEASSFSVPEMDPKDTFHLLEDGTNFHLIAGLLLLVCGLAYLAYRFIVRTFFKESIFSKLSDEYNLQLPPEVEGYYDYKEKLPDQLTENHLKELKNQLMKRAINDIPMILYMQDKSPGTYRLYHKAMINDNAWRNFQRAEALVCEEIEQVQAEAEEIEKGWGEHIWAQAMQLRKILIARSQQQEKDKEVAKQQKKAAKREKDKEKKKQRKAAQKAEIAQEVAAELIAEEEKEKSKESEKQKTKKKTPSAAKMTAQEKDDESDEESDDDEDQSSEDETEDPAAELEAQDEKKKLKEKTAPSSKTAEK